jgi:hypothetical protein
MFLTVSKPICKDWVHSSRVHGSRLDNHENGFIKYLKKYEENKTTNRERWTVNQGFLNEEKFQDIYRRP